MILLYLALACSPTKLVNMGKPTKADKAALLRAQSRCPVLYPRSPCLKEFRKTGFQTYQAICGGKQ